MQPRMLAIQEVIGDGCQWEIYHIALARKDGVRLVNHTDGGEGANGYRMRPEAIAAMRLRHIGRKLTAQHRRKIGDAGRGRKPSAETRKRMSRARKKAGGFSELAILRSAIARIGTKLPKLVREKISKSLRGRKHTPEHNGRVSYALRNHPDRVAINERATVSRRLLTAARERELCDDYLFLMPTKQLCKKYRINSYQNIWGILKRYGVPRIQNNIRIRQTQPRAAKEKRLAAVRRAWKSKDFYPSRSPAWLKRERTRRGVTQLQLANAAGVALNTVCGIERGWGAPHPKTWAVIKLALTQYTVGSPSGEKLACE
jgi:DNA-binding XRE family transcriptional regulator